MALPTLASQLAADASARLAASPLNQSITYTGTPGIDAEVLYRSETDERTGIIMDTAEIEVLVADVADPGVRDAVIIETVSWSVRDVISGDGASWRLKLMKKRRPVP